MKPNSKFFVKNKLHKIDILQCVTPGARALVSELIKIPVDDTVVKVSSLIFRDLWWSEMSKVIRSLKWLPKNYDQSKKSSALG